MTQTVVAYRPNVDPNDPVPPARAGGRSPARRCALGTAGGSRSRAGATGAYHAPLVYAVYAVYAVCAISRGRQHGALSTQRVHTHIMYGRAVRM